MERKRRVKGKHTEGKQEINLYELDESIISSFPACTRSEFSESEKILYTTTTTTPTLDASLVFATRGRKNAAQVLVRGSCVYIYIYSFPRG